MHEPERNLRQEPVIVPGPDPTGRILVLFHEYFHGDDGRGLGASHQTGWTALVVRCIEDLAGHPTEQVPPPRIA